MRTSEGKKNCFNWYIGIEVYELGHPNSYTIAIDYCRSPKIEAMT